MREYARVCPKFWTGRTGRWLRTQEPLIKVAAMYLMTCPYSEMTGLYYLPVDIMAHDIGCTPEEALKALKALKPLGSPLEGGFCDYDEKTETVWVFEMLRYQVGEVLKPKDNQIIGIKKSIEKYKNTPFYCQFIEKYGSSHCLYDTPPQAPSKPLPSPLRPSSKDKEQDITSSSYPHSSDKKEEVNSSCPEMQTDASLVQQAGKPFNGKPVKNESETILTFPTQGSVKEWRLTKEHVEKWEELFPALDILGQCRLALAWCDANPRRQKTVSGMPKFLVGWLTKAQNRGTGPIKQPTEQEQERIPTEKEWDDIWDTIENGAKSFIPPKDELL